ncbi:MAG: hypothetical protein DDG60_07710 [Anaerolineae bacterium]|nr:MAG: hypothetical protein DDG60_07710 [Anaerolineae bacterium]
MPEQWTVTLRIYRQKTNEPSRYDTFTLEVNPDEYILDAIERVWAFHDRSLCFRHACHHSTCGACGMRVNGVEKLTCITTIRSVARPNAVLTIEPLRNFPIISDLVVDMGELYRKMEAVEARAVLPITEAEIEKPPHQWKTEDSQYVRLSDCLECGLCISACPVAATSQPYLGPAPLAAAQDHRLDRRPDLLTLIDSEHGVWRCHSAFECTAVCPSFVDPGRRIMDLRKQTISAKIRHFFGK